LQSDILFHTDLNNFSFTVYSHTPDFDFIELQQIHGIKCVEPINLEEADGFIFEDLTTPLCIKTADCLPIIIETAQTNAFIHAGWRGLNNGILKQDSIKSLTNKKVFIGPHIRDCCFEVGEEFLDYFDHGIKRKNKKLYLALEEVVRKDLPDAQILSCDICTCCHKEFNSYRRDKTKQRNHNILHPIN
jgi:YfiH family protein